MLLATALSLVLSAAPAVPSLAGKSVAVLGFGLDKSIVQEGEDRDGGPGLIQTKGYYDPHQAATDTLYAHLKLKFDSLFLGAKALPLDSVRATAGYATAAECKPKKIFGREIWGCNDLSPKGGLYAVSLGQAQDNLDPFAKSLGLDYYLIFLNRASYKMWAGATIGGMGGGSARMQLETTVYLLKPGTKDVVWSGSWGDVCETSRGMVAGIYNTDNYVLVGEAFDKILPKLHAELAKGLAKP